VTAFIEFFKTFYQAIWDNMEVGGGRGGLQQYRGRHVGATLACNISPPSFQSAEDNFALPPLGIHFWYTTTCQSKNTSNMSSLLKDSARE
jgi:hypothetical protein